MSVNNDGFCGEIIEMSERIDDSYKPFYVVVVKCENRPNLRFNKRVRVREVR